MGKDSLLWCLSLAVTLTATAARGFVAPPAEPEAVAHVPIGVRVLRPQLGPTRHEALEAGKASESQVRYDLRSGTARVISGGALDDLPTLEGAATREAFEAQCRRYVEDHADQLGLSPAELELNEAAVLLDDDVQFLKFRVRRNGLLVDDAGLDFRFKRGRLVQVVNQTFAEAADDGRPVRPGLDKVAAAQVLGAETEPTGERYRVLEDKNGYRLVRVAQFEVTAQDGRRYQVQVEAATGAVFEVRPRTFHLDGSAQGDVHPRWYSEPLVQRGYPHLSLANGSAPVTTDGQGLFAGASAQAQPKLDGFIGRYVKIVPKTGAKVVSEGSLVGQQWQVRFAKSGTTPVNNDKNVAQSMVFYHTNAMIQYAKRYVSTAWLDKQLQANVNLAQTCNAHWDGTTINFYSGGGGCANTGLIADVVYHEWGHGLDDHTGGIDDGAYSEGFGDIMSLIMTQSNVLGIGFRTDGSPVRDLEPNKIYPRDRGEVHAEGLIIASTFYDLYQGLVEAHGKEAAVDKLSTYAFKTVFTATRYNDVYDALLVVDDDDGNLNNGTPNYCLVNSVFTAHGLATADAACQLATVEGFEVDDARAGNGNGVIEPGETVDLWLTARNAAATPLTGLGGELTLTAPNGIRVRDGAMSWDTIPARSALRSGDAATIEVPSTLACGTRFDAKVALKADSRSANVTAGLTLGRLDGTVQSVRAAGLPLAIRDNATVTANLTVDGEQWQAQTGVHAARLRFTIRHTYLGDLKVKLIAPDGTQKSVYEGSGSGDNVTFDEDVTALVQGLKGQGTWRLAVSDTASQDQGTLEHAEFVVTPARFVCQ